VRVAVAGGLEASVRDLATGEQVRCVTEPGACRFEARAGARYEIHMDGVASHPPPRNP